MSALAQLAYALGVLGDVARRYPPDRGGISPTTTRVTYADGTTAPTTRRRVHEMLPTASPVRGPGCCGRGSCWDTCECTPCACGHCLHRHEKWRWGRLCEECTPAAFH